MNTKALLILCSWMQLLSYSHQEIVRVNVTPKIANESDEVVLKCNCEPGYSFFQWTLNDDVIVTTNDSGITVLEQGKNPEVYTVVLFKNKAGNDIYKLTITNVSRYDNGRWSCNVGNDSGLPPLDQERVVASIRYTPDPQYPQCQIDNQGYTTCTTQLGNPRVEFRWTDYTADESDRPRGENEMTENVIFRSQLNVLSLNPPENVNDTVECEITQTSKARSCVTTKEDIYFNSNLTLVSDEDNFIFTCSVSPSVFRNYLRWFWTSSSINASGNVTDYRQNGTRLALDNVNTMSHETFIRCELSWGVFNYSYVDILVPMDTPTTQATSVWTKAREGKNSVSTQGGMTLDHVDGNERTSVGPHSEDHTMMTMMKSSVSLMSSTSVPSTSVSTTAPEGKNSVSTQGGVILDHVDGTERTSVGPHSEDHTMMTMMKSSVSLISSTSVPSTSVSTTAPEGKNSVSTQGGVILDNVNGTERTSVEPHSEDHTKMKSNVSLISSTSVPSTSVSTTAREGKSSVSTQSGVILDHVDGTERTSVGPHSEDHTMMKSSVSLISSTITGKENKLDAVNVLVTFILIIIILSLLVPLTLFMIAVAYVCCRKIDPPRAVVV